MLDLRNVFRTKNNVLRNLLSKYTGLRLIGADQDNNNRRFYLTEILVDGWYYVPLKNPDTGDITETLKIVSGTAVDDAVASAVQYELLDNVGGFLRFKHTAKSPPKPPGFEWIIEVTPNAQDTRVIN